MKAAGSSTTAQTLILVSSCGIQSGLECLIGSGKTAMKLCRQVLHQLPWKSEAVHVAGSAGAGGHMDQPTCSTWGRLPEPPPLLWQRRAVSGATGTT